MTQVSDFIFNMHLLANISLCTCKKGMCRKIPFTHRCQPSNLKHLCVRLSSWQYILMHQIQKQRFGLSWRQVHHISSKYFPALPEIAIMILQSARHRPFVCGAYKNTKYVPANSEVFVRATVRHSLATCNRNLPNFRNYSALSPIGI